LYGVKGQRHRGIPAAPPVEIRASQKRRSTVSASWEDGRIVVLVPSRLGTAERDAVVDELVKRLLKRAPMHHSDDVELEARSRELADRYLDGVRASSVRWVGNQKRRWGSCSPATGDIRISDRLRPVPSWVLDAVLVHELAHLIEGSHSRRFRSLTARYPRMSEADTFLHGFSVGLEAAHERRDGPRSIDDDVTAVAEDDDLVPPAVEHPAPLPPEHVAAYPRPTAQATKGSQGRLFDLVSRS
jgi:predicted metal-dependent hydrolase